MGITRTLLSVRRRYITGPLAVGRFKINFFYEDGIHDRTSWHQYPCAIYDHVLVMSTSTYLGTIFHPSVNPNWSS